MTDPSRHRRRSLFRCGVPLLVAVALHAPLGAQSGPPAFPTDGGGQVPAAAADTPPPGSALRVWLVTVGPGDAVWERFGHNAIRVVDPERGTDVSYNWGIFDFDQVDFVPRFLRGEMLYSMAPFPTGRMLESYARANREVILQELELTAAQKAALQEFGEWNALPENRDYFYDYFLDNCSTRVRDVLDRTLDGLLAARFREAPTGTSYRTHTRRLTAVDPLVFTGMDLLLGSPGDPPISVWEEMFVPMTLRDAVREVRVVGEDGVERPLVRSEEVVFAANRELEPREPPRWGAIYLALGVLLGGSLMALGRAAGVPVRGGGVGAPGGSPQGPWWARLGLVALGGGWSLLAGVGGAILVAVLFTDHHFMYRNESLFQANPLSLAAAVLLPVTLLSGRGLRVLRWAAWGVLALSLAGVAFKLLPGSIQDNTILVLLALPIHLGLALGLGFPYGPPRGLPAPGSLEP